MSLNISESFHCLTFSVSIGGVTVPVTPPKDFSKVPINVVPPVAGLDLDLEEILQHLKWMFQKTLLKQDIFLIGYISISRLSWELPVLFGFEIGVRMVTHYL